MASLVIATFNVYLHTCQNPPASRFIDEKLFVADIVCTQEDVKDITLKNFNLVRKCGNDQAGKASGATIGVYLHKKHQLDSITDIQCVQHGIRHAIVFRFQDLIIANLFLEGGRESDSRLLSEPEVMLEKKLGLCKKVREHNPHIVLGDFNSTKVEGLNGQYEYFRQFKTDKQLTDKDFATVKSWNLQSLGAFGNTGYLPAYLPEGKITTGRGQSVVDHIWHKLPIGWKFEVADVEIAIKSGDRWNSTNCHYSDHNAAVAKFVRTSSEMRGRLVRSDFRLAPVCPPVCENCASDMPPPKDPFADVPEYERWFVKVFGNTEDYMRRNVDRKSSELTLVNGRKVVVDKFRLENASSLMKQLMYTVSVGPAELKFLTGDVSQFMVLEFFNHATFQMASQFNGLEFINPLAIPENGIAIYKNDRTQGPAVAMSTAPATFYRNYMYKWPDGTIGQTEHHQINTFAPVNEKLKSLGLPTVPVMNGYGMVGSVANLQRLAKWTTEVTDAMNTLQIGVHSDADVVGSLPLEEDKDMVPERSPLQQVTLVTASSFAINSDNVVKASKKDELYRHITLELLTQTYKLTLLAAEANRRKYPKSKSAKRVVLTTVGGGVFATDISRPWVVQAIHAALKAAPTGLEIYINWHKSKDVKDLDTEKLLKDYNKTYDRFLTPDQLRSAE